MSGSDSPTKANRLPPRSPMRVAGLVVVGALSVYLAGVSTWRIFQTTLFVDPGQSEYTCREGTKALYESVERARTRTASLAKPEREALAIFRRELEPTWKQVHAVRAACAKDQDRKALKTLRSVTLLRYAEERAVRYQAIDLTRWRKQAPQEVLALTAP